MGLLLQLSFCTDAICRIQNSLQISGLPFAFLYRGDFAGDEFSGVIVKVFLSIGTGSVSRRLDAAMLVCKTGISKSGASLLIKSWCDESE